MKKRIQKHMENQEYVKVSISDEDGSFLDSFNGFIFEQNSKHIMMCYTHDFTYEGIVVIRKADVSEIKRTENEIFFQKILEYEGLKKAFFDRKAKLNFQLDSYENMFNLIRKMKIPIELEAVYGKDNRFQIGPIAVCDQKKVKINYFNSRGEFDLKPVSCKYKEITHFTIDSPYANTFFKYSKPIQ